MAGKVNIEWTERAIADLESMYNFLLIHWTKKEAEKFLDLTLDFQSFISKYPLAFNTSHRRKAYRLGLIHKNVTAVYRVDPEKITIIALVDNRSRNKYR